MNKDAYSSLFMLFWTETGFLMKMHFFWHFSAIYDQTEKYFASRLHLVVKCERETFTMLFYFLLSSR